MRISTLLSQQIGLRTMADQEARMLHTMQQLGSGRRVLTPADDPLAASQAINVAQTSSMNERLAENRNVAWQNLAAQEQILSEVTTVLQGVITRVVEAGNGTYSDTQLRALADTLSETRASLLGMANTTDGNGQYLFSGNVGDQAPYSAAGEANPAAELGKRNVQISQTRVMPTGDLAVNIFGRVSPGAQGYIASVLGNPSSPSNLGNVTFGQATMDAEATPSPSYKLKFELSDPADQNSPIRINVTDADDQSVTTIPYNDGQEIDIDGVRLTLSGTPAVGDTISLERLDSQEYFELLNTLDTFISALENGTATPQLKAEFTNVLNTTNRKMYMHLDNVLTVRASLGARMNEIDALDNEGENRSLNYAAQLSKLEDVDYRKASSDIAQHTMALEAAQLAYLKVQNLSLFSRK